MGAEGSIEICEDDEIEKDLGFLRDESMTEMFNRNFDAMIDVLIHPTRMDYNFDWLKTNYNGCDDYEINEFKYACADGIKLHCVKWVRDPNADLCVVYLHTNTRCLCDATELLPLCNLLNANLLSFDQRGSGKSDGHLSFRIADDLTAILESLGSGNRNVKVILWARGMASSVGIEYITRQQKNISEWNRTAPARRMVARERYLKRKKEKQKALELGEEVGDEMVDEEQEEDLSPPQYVKFLVLDSPYTSLKEVVLEATNQIDVLGAHIPSVFIKFALYMFKSKIQESLDMDPYAISPIQWVKEAKKAPLGEDEALPPCYILAADNDEYIPCDMGAELAKEWMKRAGKKSCWFREFPGGHFDEREEILVMTPIQAILDYVSIYEIPKGESVDGKVDLDCDYMHMRPVKSGGNSEVETEIDDKEIRMSSPDKSPDKNHGENKSGEYCHLESPPKWQDSIPVTHCNFCCSPFTILNRKHHCRRCGLVVCSTCSSSRISLPASNRITSPGKNKNKAEDCDVEKVRVCDTCVNLLNLKFKK